MTTLKNERILHYKGQRFPFPAVFSTSTSTDHDVFFDSKRYNHCIKQMPKYLLKGYNNYRDILKLLWQRYDPMKAPLVLHFEA